MGQILKFCYTCDEALFGTRSGYWSMSCKQCLDVPDFDLKPITPDILANFGSTSIRHRIRRMALVNDGFFTYKAAYEAMYANNPSRSRKHWQYSAGSAIARMVRDGLVTRLDRGYYTLVYKGEKC